MPTVNLTPDQIHDEFKRTKGLKVKELLKNSYIPEELVVQYLDRLFSSNADWYHRSIQIVDMFKRNKVQISTDTLETINNKFSVFVETKGIGEIFDFNAYNLTISDEDFYVDNTIDVPDVNNPSVNILFNYVTRNPSNLSPELLKRFYSCKNYVRFQWDREIYEALTPELKDVMRQMHPLDKYNDEYNKSMMFHLYDAIDILKVSTLYNLEVALAGNFQGGILDQRAVRDSIKESPEMMDIFIDKVLNTPVKKITQYPAIEKFVKHIINDHERKAEVLDYFTPVLDKVHAIPFDEVDWHSLGNKLQDMTIEERHAWFSRKDVPVWFQNENAGVMMHLMLSRPESHDKNMQLQAMLFDKLHHNGRGFFE